MYLLYFFILQINIIERKYEVGNGRTGWMILYIHKGVTVVSLKVILYIHDSETRNELQNEK